MFILRAAVPMIFGLGLVLAGVYVLKNANIRRHTRPSDDSVKKKNLKKNRGLGKIAWIVAVVSLMVTLISFGVAFEYLRTGQDHVWPVYGIAIGGQIFAIAIAHICGVYGRNLFK